MMHDDDEICSSVEADEWREIGGVVRRRLRTLLQQQVNQMGLGDLNAFLAVSERAKLFDVLTHNHDEAVENVRETLLKVVDEE